MLIYNIETNAGNDSSGPSVRITFPNGDSVIIYPDAQRDNVRTMVVNVCTDTECVASVEMSADNVVTYNFKE